ncbi:MAG: hypothetical protein II364_00415 [Bacteroidales bacterium]|nr:hypothetical protein [Bacteroidales bacterium]
MKKYLFIFLVAAFTWTGCQKEPAGGSTPEQGQEQEQTPPQDERPTITFTTSKAVGEKITLGFNKYEIANISIIGAKAESATPIGDWRSVTYKLNSQTVTIKGDITNFDCRSNDITSLTLSKDLKLTELNCVDNNLTVLDASLLTKLELLDCSNNSLSSLNLSGCQSLYYVDCDKNAIKDAAMTTLVNDLPALGAPGVGRLIVTSKDCKNVISVADIDIANDKNWDVMDNAFNKLEGSLDISGATHFIKTANCHIVSKSGIYSFSPVKGCSYESVGQIASAEVLWESFGTSVTPSVGDLIEAVVYKKGVIGFKATDRKGNAVIAAKDASGNILWSWHIWMTNQPQEQVYFNNAGTMMDRNLGATCATPGDAGALGLLYQWGRKDPFLSASSIGEQTLAQSTITWPQRVTSSSYGSIAFSISHPTTFIRLNDRNYDWLYTGTSSTDNTRWTTSDKDKSIYDPCPAGWRVPDGGSNGVWAKAVGASSAFEKLFDSTKMGMDFSNKFGLSSSIWYPAAGSRMFDTGKLDVVGAHSRCWSASPGNDYLAYAFVGSFTHNAQPAGETYRSYGLSVRCIKE